MIVVSAPPLGALQLLGGALHGEHRESAGVEIDDPSLTARRFRRPEAEAAMLAAAVRAVDAVGLDLDKLLMHGDPSAVEIDVVPSQTDELPAAQARHGGHLEDDRQSVTLGVLQEPAEFGRLPRSHLGTGHLR